MWLKLIGTAILLLCGGLWANGQTRQERREATQVAALCDLFSHMGEQIETLCLPLDEILNSVSPALLSACGLTSPVSPDALSPLADQLRDSDAADIVARATAQLGRGCREDQVRLCRATAQSLSACRERMMGEVTRNTRARWTLTLTAMLCGVILLW